MLFVIIYIILIHIKELVEKLLFVIIYIILIHIKELVEK